MAMRSCAAFASDVRRASTARATGSVGPGVWARRKASSVIGGSVAPGFVCHNRRMVGRTLLSRAEPGFTMPAFERLAPPPPPDAVVAHLEAFTGPGRSRRRPPRSRRLGCPGRHRSSAASPDPREQPLDPPARGGRPATAGPAAPRCRVLHPRSFAARGLEPEARDRVDVRDSLCDLRTRPPRRRVHLGGHGTGPGRVRTRRAAHWACS